MTAAVRTSPFSEVLEAFGKGEMVIIADDATRENEGDIAVATEMLTEAQMQFMMQHARGLICVSISVERAEALNLPLQVINNSSPFQTPFLVSVDHKLVAGNAVSAAARAQSMRQLIAKEAKAEDFVSPGHIFPLAANPDGVVARRGQTEGSFDLARLAGLQPSGVICEILNPDGTMARGKELEEFALRHGLKMTSVEDILRYRVTNEILVHQVGQARLNTDWGEFDTIVFEDDFDGKEHLALVRGDVRGAKVAPLLRLHSECLTGDVFGSRRCDCGKQLALAMEAIVQEGCGIILYLRQEGRGIGLTNKLRAYALQEEGHDTVEANIRLGFEPDARDFAVAAKMLEQLQLRKVRLMTNNPRKLSSLQDLGIEVTERIPLQAAEDEYCRAYLRAKKEKLGHIL